MGKYKFARVTGGGIFENIDLYGRINEEKFLVLGCKDEDQERFYQAILEDDNKNQVHGFKNVEEVKQYWEESGDMFLTFKEGDFKIVEERQYYWSFDKDCELWSEWEYSIEDCIRQANASNDNKYEYVYIGVLEEHIPRLDGISIIEDLVDQADSDFSDGVDDWLQNVKKVDIEEFENDLNEILIKWLMKVDQMPEFGEIVDIKQYKLY